MACNNRITYGNQSSRVCIVAKRVFDACLQQIAREDEELIVDFPEPAVSFVDLQVAGPGVISDLTITPTNTAGCSRVRFTLTVPLEVIALNAGGQEIVGTTTIRFDLDLYLRTPTESLVPTEVTCTVNLRGYLASIDGNVLTCTICANIIVRITADVDIVVNACGPICLPSCREVSENICSGFFSLPIYPTGL